MKGILGRKIGMTQIFTTDGKLIPVTVVEAEPNVVLQVRTQDKDGYTGLKLAVEEKRAALVNKADAGQFKKANTTPKRFVQEITGMEGFNQGDMVKADLFAAGEFVDVTGVSKGKGFAGSIKRHNYSIGPKGHGSGYHRGVGSMGPIAPNRIMKSKLMPGHMGNEQVTIQNLEIVSVDVAKNVILIKGSIPGPKKQFIAVKETIKHIAPKTPEQLLSWSKAQPEETIAPASAAVEK